MVDDAFIQGAVVSVAGFVTGIGIAIFAEKQINRAEARGSAAVGDGTRAKMASMFIEDTEMPTDLDETIRKMEVALAKARGEEAPDEDAKKEALEKSKPDDGW
eukprot:CAMPEP_0118920210 /NCGR_PEP_ID=MMETSP1166-20130328/18952_1 /TAXON_ID=1104430 /ORGANISM="Chrysoreinhardia sp, Strain CCMP3193" /LENGTH=102 /DNA_ID=CAMNT_0006860747 /DNA_START=168 /DNA_END=476 /DNA_ORIENTATION=-